MNSGTTGAGRCTYDAQRRIRPQVSELKDALDESNIPFRIDLHVWDEIPEKFHEIIRSEYLIMKIPER